MGPDLIPRALFCVLISPVNNFTVMLQRNVLICIYAASWENQQFAYAKTKTQISLAVTAKLISAFVFATRIVQSLYFLNTKFHASSCFLLLHRPGFVLDLFGNHIVGFPTRLLIYADVLKHQ